MGINVGDAILRFLADTTQLDQAIDTVNQEVPGKLKPAQEGVREIGGAFDKAAASAQGLAKEAINAGTVGKTAGAEIATGMTEAGVAAEGAAFGMVSVAAASGLVLFGIGAIVPLIAQLPGYAQEVWESMTGWSQAEADAYQQLVLINQEMLTFSRSLETQKAHLSEIPLEGSARAAEYVKNLRNADLKEALANFDDARKKVQELDSVLHGQHEETWVDELGGTLTVQIPNAAGKSKEELAKVADELKAARDAAAETEKNLKRIQDVKIPGADLQRQVAVQHEQEQAAAKTAAAEREASAAEKQRVRDTVAAWRAGLQERKDDQQAFHEFSKQDEANYWAQVYLQSKRGSEEAKIAWHEMRQAQQGADKEALTSQVADVRLAVANAAQGSQERVDIIENELKLMRSLGQQGSKEYRALEIEKVNAVRQAAAATTRERQKALRIDAEIENEEKRFQIASLQERSRANDDYYNNLYERGKISFEQLVDLKIQESQALYDLEVEALHRRFQATGPEEVVERKKILDQVLLLTEGHNNEVIRLEREKADAIETTTIGMNRGMNAEQQWFNFWVKGAPKLSQIWKSLAATGKQMFSDLKSAQESAVASWILGQDSLGHAMRKATASVLAEYAARAAIEAIYWTAYGFAMLATMQYDRAAQAFTAAGMLAGFAVVAGAAAYAINPRDQKDDQGGKQQTIDNSAGQAEQTITTNRNVHRFGAGALVSTPTLAIVGDAKSTMGSAREGILPLDDPEAMGQIAEALSATGFGGNRFYIEGLISADNLDQVIARVNKRVESNDVHLTSSVAHRVVRKS